MFRLTTFTTEGTSNSNKASRPFEAVSVDLGYQHGTHYLVLIDRYSGWPMVKPLKKLNTAEVASILEDWFLEH